MSQRTPIKRLDFVRKFISAGFTHDEASRAYMTMIAVLEDAVVAGDKVKFAGIGCLFPVRKPPRDVVMGFERRGSRVVRTKRVFHLDERVEYKFNFYKSFSRKHGLGRSS